MKPKVMFKRSLLLFALMAGVQLQAALPVAVDGQPLPSLAPILQRVTPSVVNIHTQTRVRVRSPLLDDPFFRRFFNVPDIPRERVSQSLGSGVIVNADQGYIITNNHVIEGADDIQVTLKDGGTHRAELIGADPDTDVAVIRIDTDGLQALPLAQSEQLQVGDFVVAVGNPFGLGQTVTSGIVSALGRVGIRGLEYQNFIQTDASINPGNSGGALINLRGELVGINTAIFTPSGGNVGIGFAIPSSMASDVMAQLIAYGEVRRGSLGIEVQALTAELAQAFRLERAAGAVIAEVASGSAAAAAGLQPGDVIVSIDEQPVLNVQEFRNIEGLMPIGKTLNVDYLRDGRRARAQVSIEAIQSLSGDRVHSWLRGAIFRQLPKRLARGLGVDGVQIEELNERSRLWAEGLRPGDVIIGINRRPVRSLQDFQGIMEGQRGRIQLRIYRNGRSYVAILE